MHDLIRSFACKNIDSPIYDAHLWTMGHLIGVGTARISFNSRAERFMLSFYATRSSLEAEQVSYRANMTTSKYTVFGQDQSGLLVEASAYGQHIRCRHSNSKMQFELFLSYAEMYSDPDTDFEYGYKPLVSSYIQTIRSPIWELYSTKEKASADSLTIQGNRDGLGVNHNSTKILVKKESKSFSYVDVFGEGEESVDELENIHRAFMDSLCFCVSDDISTMAQYIRTRKSKKVRLFPGLVLENRIGHTFPPIPYENPNDKNCSKFISKAMDFFIDPNTHKLRTLLKYIVDSIHLDFSGMELACGTAIEGISRYILEEHLKSKDSKLFEYRQSLDQALEDDARKARSILRSSSESIASIDKILTHLRFVQRESTREKLKAAAEIIDLDLTDVETLCWSKMRNPATHWDPTHRYKLEQRQDHWTMSLVTFEKLLVKLVGWNGPINDWASNIRERIEHEQSK